MSKLRFIKDFENRLTDTLKFFIMGVYIAAISLSSVFFLKADMGGNSFITIFLFSALLLLALVYLAIILKKILRDMTQ